MFWTKKTAEKITISDYLDIKNQELLNTELKLVDHNDMIYICKKEVEVAQFGIYFTQYYFKKEESDSAIRLTKENLIRNYKNSGFILALKVFLNTYKVIRLNEYGHLCLFDIINSHAEKRAYQLLEYEALHAKSS